MHPVAQKILRHADMNPNTTGAELLVGAGAGNFAVLQADLVAGKLKALWMVGEDLPLSENTLPNTGA